MSRVSVHSVPFESWTAKTKYHVYKPQLSNPEMCMKYFSLPLIKSVISALLSRTKDRAGVKDALPLKSRSVFQAVLSQRSVVRRCSSSCFRAQVHLQTSSPSRYGRVRRKSVWRFRIQVSVVAEKVEINVGTRLSLSTWMLSQWTASHRLVILWTTRRRLRHFCGGVVGDSVLILSSLLVCIRTLLILRELRWANRMLALVLPQPEINCSSFKSWVWNYSRSEEIFVICVTQRPWSIDSVAFLLFLIRSSNELIIPKHNIWCHNEFLFTSFSITYTKCLSIFDT